MHDTKTISAAVARYFEMWNETDPQQRRAAVEAVWTPDAKNIDPIADTKGWDAIEHFVIELQEQYPQHVVVLDGAINHHHDRAIFSWLIRSPAGATILSGKDCVRLAEDGRFAELAGFFDGSLPS